MTNFALIQYTRLRLWYYSAALRQLSARDPLHADVPALVMHVNDLQSSVK